MTRSSLGTLPGAWGCSISKAWSNGYGLKLSVSRDALSMSSATIGLSRLKYYSWCVAFAPADDPEIAVASLVVNGETWSTKGAVPARAILDTWAAERSPEAASP